VTGSACSPAARVLTALVAVTMLGGAACAPAADAPSAAAPTPDLVAAPLHVPQSLSQPPFDRQRRPLLPSGWTMAVWARVPGARLAAWAPDGTLLVSRPSAGQVVRLSPGPGSVVTSVLLDGLTRPHGLAFAGDTLYVAESDRIVGYRYGAGTAGGPRAVVAGLPDARSPELGGAYAHALKSVVTAPDGSIYYSVGSTGNISAVDRGASPPRAVIMRVPPGGSPEVFASGVRNGTGLSVARDGSVWTAVNNRDDIGYPYDRPYGDASGSSLGDVLPRYVADHPVEELARLTPGRDLGWPFCNPEADAEPGVAGTRYLDGALAFVRDVQTNPDGSHLDCAALPPVERSLGAHSAPLGLSFTELPGPFGPGALVGVHGSWNRTPPRAPEVSFFARRDGGLGPQQTLVGGFQVPDGSRWGRPVAAVRGPDGAVYITDDAAGAVYRLAPPGR
jgi:glucose/arabinose dehydrogenase